jgi:hypothetical protein
LVIRQCRSWFGRFGWSTLKMIRLPEVLSCYYVHGDSLSQRAMCWIATGQLRRFSFANISGCSVSGVA